MLEVEFLASSPCDGVDLGRGAAGVDRFRRRIGGRGVRLKFWTSSSSDDPTTAAAAAASSHLSAADLSILFADLSTDLLADFSARLSAPFEYLSAFDFSDLLLELSWLMTPDFAARLVRAGFCTVEYSWPPPAGSSLLSLLVEEPE